MTPAARPRLTGAVLLCAGLLAACAGGVPPPTWQLNARSAAEGAVQATLSGDSRAAERDLARARAEVARTGRADLLARVELMHCAARVASLDFSTCDRFEPLRTDAGEAERAYADHLAGRTLPAAQQELLPSAQRTAARATPDAAHTALAGVDDPIARLVAAGVLMRQGRASPAVMALAVDTASAQGWRRPLLAWLQAAALRAEQGGDAQEAARLRRRIELVLRGP